MTIGLYIFDTSEMCLLLVSHQYFIYEMKREAITLR